MTTASVGQILVAAMAAHDVDYAFCVPGESYLPVLDAFHDENTVTPVVAHHEEGAGFMAHAWARATGRPGVAMVTRGPGMTHLSIAIHAARQDSVPLVVIAGQVPQSSVGRESFQELDMVSFGELVGKGGVAITSADRAAEQIQRAFYLAVSGRPGPVVVSLPEDIGYETTSNVAVNRQPIPLSVADPTAVRDAAAALSRARSVAIVVGGGVGGTDCDLVVRLAERVGAAVYCGWRRFDGFPNTHPQFAGNLPWLPGDLTESLTSAEVVLAVGTRMGDFTSLGYTVPAEDQQLIQIDIAHESVVATRDRDIALVADAAQTCRALLELVHVDEEPLAQRTARARETGLRYLELTECPAPMDSDDVVDVSMAITAMREILGPEAAITSDAGSFAGYLNRYYRWRTPGTFFGTTAGAMGYAIPAAIGAKLADPHRPVVAVAGDGGFAMTMSEIHTAARLGLGGLVFVSFDNGVYGTIKSHQQRRFPGREIAIELTRADLARAGSALGANGVRVTSDAEFAAALKAGVEAEGPTVIHAITSPDQLAAWAD